MQMFGNIAVWVGKIWLVLAVIFILASYGTIIYFQGWSKFQEIASPFNIINFIAVALTIAPGLGFLKLGEYLKLKAEAKKQQLR